MADPRLALLAEAEHESDGHRLGDSYHPFEAIDAFPRRPAAAGKFLSGLCFSAEDHCALAANVSGGCAMSCRWPRPVLRAPPTCCCWTNHQLISIGTRVWLENFHQTIAATILIVSHTATF